MKETTLILNQIKLDILLKLRKSRIGIQPLRESEDVHGLDE